MIRGQHVVFKGYTASDLGTAYYKTNAPIVDIQIAKVLARFHDWSDLTTH